MKKMIILIAIFSLAFSKDSSSQVRLNVNVNIGSQPDWGPSGYDYVDYYYMPDYDVYYYVPRRQFVYLSGNNWIFGTALPARYGRVNLYNSYKVVINEPRPYLRNDVYGVKYSGYRGWNGRQPYNKGNIRYVEYKTKKSGGRGNNNGNGNSRGRGNGNGHGNGRGHGNGHH